jgi:hypothetical protein
MDPKENLKKTIKKAKSILDPKGAEQDEKNETNEKLDEVKEAVKGEGMEKAFTAGDFLSGFLKQIKGDPGEKPEKGKDYLTDEEMASIVKEATPILGKDYLTEQDIQDLIQITTPKKGTDYFTDEDIEDFVKKVTPIKGVHYKDGEDGKDIDEDELIAKVIKKLNLKDGKPGKDGTNADPKDVVKLLKELPEKETLDISDLRNSAQLRSAIGKLGKLDMNDQRWHGGGITGVNTDKITVSDTAPSDPKLNDLWCDIS